MNLFARTKMLIGEKQLEQLHQKTVAVFGLGGVGGYVVEGLVRSGIGHLIVIDHDVISESNMNRQLIATTDVIGQKKVDLIKERALKINPNIKVTTYDIFFDESYTHLFDNIKVDYIVDAIDTVTAKLLIIEMAKRLNIPIIASMGTGNKLDPSQFVITDIEKTSTCPLARVMRRELKKRHIKDVKVIYSKEQPLTPIRENEIETTVEVTTGFKKLAPGSISFVPPVAGLMIAGEVIRDLIK